MMCCIPAFGVPQLCCRARCLRPFKVGPQDPREKLRGSLGVLAKEDVPEGFVFGKCLALHPPSCRTQ